MTKEDKIKEFLSLGLTTKEMADYFEVSQRSVQFWLKDMGLNRTLKEAKKIHLKRAKDKKRLEGVKSLFNEELEYRKRVTKSLRFPRIEGDFALYRFLDVDGKTLYIGKCERSLQSNGHRKKNGECGKRIYFLKDRITLHYAKSSKHLPKKVYEDTKRIEYSLCLSRREMLNLESNLILTGKFKGECLWNGCFGNELIEGYPVDSVCWEKYVDID